MSRPTSKIAEMLINHSLKPGDPRYIGQEFFESEAKRKFDTPIDPIEPKDTFALHDRFDSFLRFARTDTLLKQDDSFRTVLTEKLISRLYANLNLCISAIDKHLSRKKTVCGFILMSGITRPSIDTPLQLNAAYIIYNNKLYYLNKDDSEFTEVSDNLNTIKKICKKIMPFKENTSVEKDNAGCVLIFGSSCHDIPIQFNAAYICIDNNLYYMNKITQEYIKIDITKEQLEQFDKVMKSTDTTSKGEISQYRILSEDDLNYIKSITKHTHHEYSILSEDDLKYIKSIAGHSHSLPLKGSDKLEISSAIKTNKIMNLLREQCHSGPFLRKMLTACEIEVHIVKYNQIEKTYSLTLPTENFFKLLYLIFPNVPKPVAIPDAWEILHASGCDFLVRSTLPDDDTLIPSNAAYIRVGNQLFYINKAEKKSYTISIDNAMLEKMHQQLLIKRENVDEDINLTLAELQYISEITTHVHNEKYPKYDRSTIETHEISEECAMNLYNCIATLQRKHIINCTNDEYTTFESLEGIIKLTKALELLSIIGRVSNYDKDKKLFSIAMDDYNNFCMMTLSHKFQIHYEREITTDSLSIMLPLKYLKDQCCRVQCSIVSNFDKIITEAAYVRNTDGIYYVNKFHQEKRIQIITNDISNRNALVFFDYEIQLQGRNIKILTDEDLGIIESLTSHTHEGTHRILKMDTTHMLRMVTESMKLLELSPVKIKFNLGLYDLTLFSRDARKFAIIKQKYDENSVIYQQIYQTLLLYRAKYDPTTISVTDKIKAKVTPEKNLAKRRKVEAMIQLLECYEYSKADIIRFLQRNMEALLNNEIVGSEGTLKTTIVTPILELIKTWNINLNAVNNLLSKNIFGEDISELDKEYACAIISSLRHALVYGTSDGIESVNLTLPTKDPISTALQELMVILKENNVPIMAVSKNSITVNLEQYQIFASRIGATIPKGVVDTLKIQHITKKDYQMICDSFIPFPKKIAALTNGTDGRNCHKARVILSEVGVTVENAFWRGRNGTVLNNGFYLLIDDTNWQKLQKFIGNLYTKKIQSGLPTITFQDVPLVEGTPDESIRFIK